MKLPTLNSVAKCLYAISLVALASCVSGRLPKAASATGEPLALIGATVIDLEGGTSRVATILIDGNRIVSVAPAGDTTIPHSARVVEIAGTFVIPGLWDMHAHTVYANPAEVERAFLPVLVAHGVLGIRDPASRFNVQQTERWRSAISQGRLVGPHLASLGRVVDSRATTIGTIVVHGEMEARAAVASISREGFDFVKPYNDLSGDTYREVVREASRLGLVVAGHLPYAVSAREASDLGQRSIEHLTNMWFEVSGADALIRGRILRGLAAGESPQALFLAKIDSLFPLAFETYDAAKERELFELFARNGTWHVPTLVVDRHLSLLDSGNAAATALALRLLPRWVRESGVPLDRFLGELAPTRRATLEELYRREAAMVGRMQSSGVGIMAGSDSPLHHLAPGAALHAELAALVRDAGLTPIQALRTATVNPARYLGVADSVGRVAPGMVADLVVLDADPRADIRNTLRIRAVVARGRFFHRAELDGLIAAAERATGQR